MGKVRAKSSSDSQQAMRPALTPEARENQMISLAESLAEKQLREGTASSQVISHYLKLAATKEERKLERERQEKEMKLIDAKVDNIKSQQKSDELFEKALKAFAGYSGQGDPDEY